MMMTMMAIIVIIRTRMITAEAAYTITNRLIDVTWNIKQNTQ